VINIRYINHGLRHASMAFNFGAVLTTNKTARRQGLQRCACSQHAWSRCACSQQQKPFCVALTSTLLPASPHASSNLVHGMTTHQKACTTAFDKRIAPSLAPSLALHHQSNTYISCPPVQTHDFLPPRFQSTKGGGEGIQAG